MSDTFGGGLSVGQPLSLAPPDPGTPAPAAAPTPAAPAAPQQPASGGGGLFGSGLVMPGQPNYTPPGPAASALDQTADTLQQRIKRANDIATNPVAQFLNPEAASAARDFIPQATEQLQKIRQQKATMAAGRTQAETLGLSPGDAPDEASQADRVAIAQAKALKGDMRVFQGLQAVDPKAAEAIQDQVHAAVAGHLTNAQTAFDNLAGMQNAGQYDAKLKQLRADGTLSDLEALGMKVPKTFDDFNATKGREGAALRDARVSMDNLRQHLEDRNTYQPMEKKEAETYNGRLTTAYGDQITNGTWGRNGASGTRGLIINGAADPRGLGKDFTLATPEQRKSIEEESDKVIPKEERDKYRAFNRTYQLATHDGKGNLMPDGTVNTNPNVQQGMAEGLASMLRGGNGGANVGLLKIETNKRGFLQGLVDRISTEKGAVINELKGADVNPYLSKLTQTQIRDVMDAIKQYNDVSIGDRASKVAERAGALGLDAAAIGYGGKETAGTINDAIERGRQAQIARMTPSHQAIGGGDGVFQLGAQRPGAGTVAIPPGTQPANQLPGAAPLATPVQQAQQPAGSPPVSPGPAGPGAPPAMPNPSAQQPPIQPGGSGPAGGAPSPVQPSAPASPGAGGGPPSPANNQPLQPGGGQPPVTIAGQPVNVPLPPGVSPAFVPSLQRIETGKSKDPWTAEAGKGPDGKPLSSASGAFQMIDKTWDDNKPADATAARAKDATPAQQSQAFATLIAKNAQTLTTAGVPVNDTSLYVAHNLGATGASTLLKADPNADARTVVGETAAKNNPLFFRGKPTVATVLQRYQTEMNKEPPKLPDSGASAAASAPAEGGFWNRLSRTLSQGIPGSGADKDKAVADVGNAAVNNAPAIGGTIGGITGGPVGGAAGAGSGQVLKDYLQGRPFDPAETAKQTALGGVLSVGSAARPVLAAGARVLGAGGVDAAAEAAKGGDAGDIAGEGAKGAAEGIVGESFGRALGMAGHKVFSLFGGDAKATVQAAAKSYANAKEVLDKEPPKLPGAGGAASGPNPAYEAAQAAKEKAETALKDAGLDPEAAAYAHTVSQHNIDNPTAPIGKQEAQAARPGTTEQQRVGAGYQQLENEVGTAGVGTPKATPKLPDGPRAAVESGAVPKSFGDIAEKTEAAITAPAPNWQAKWVQLKDARAALLEKEREAYASTSARKGETAEAYRALADTVRAQQEKTAKYVFGEQDGAAFMSRLKVLDGRYRTLMDATNGGDLAGMARLKGDAGRKADKAFRAFAMGDKEALAAWDAMRRTGSNVEKDVLQVISAEKIPVLGKLISGAKLMSGFKDFIRERAAGSPATFADMVPELKAAQQRQARAVRDVGGQIGSHAAVQGDVFGSAFQ